MLIDYKVILWDFDGVIMNSNHIRDEGFIQVLKEFPFEKVDQLLAFHRANGGLSRYVKFNYFIKNILNEEPSVERIAKFSESFSIIMKQLLCDQQLLIEDSVQFIKRNSLKYSMHIVSGSDQTELRYLCEKLGLDKYFLSIHGSPTPKKQLVESLIKERGYSNVEMVLIGDSINDYDAAKFNEIEFIAYNNPDLLKVTSSYITSFQNINKNV